MPFTSSAMEQAWQAVMAASGDTEWVDIISSTTGEFYRLPVTNGGLKHWNRTTGVWEVANPVPSGLIQVTARYL